jgi:hypothetical protein
MPLVILHHLLNVSVQLANKRGFKQKKNQQPYKHSAFGSPSNEQHVIHHLLNVLLQTANKLGLLKKKR